jgi:hypothetical protein
MRASPAVVHPKTGVNEQEMVVRDLIRRVESLMGDKRYPPLYNIRVDLHIPFLLKYPRH